MNSSPSSTASSAARSNFPNIRREVTPHTVRHVVLAGRPWGAFLRHSRLDESNVDAVIESEIAYFESLGLDFEWKAYDYDTPADLVARLAARGFEVEDPEAVMVLDLEHVRLLCGSRSPRMCAVSPTRRSWSRLPRSQRGGLGREVRLAGQGVG